jgi:MoaA/NifB/PqqE/SkfB family radical SAM enzyme
MCSLYGKEGLLKKNPPSFLKDKDIEVKYLFKLIKDVSIFRPNIILTGGEPLLYKDWYGLAKYIREKKLRTFLATGGMLLEENAEKIVDCIDHIQISLDSGKSEIHDKSRGVKGSFEKIIRGIEKIDLIKKEKNFKKPFINICCTITDINYKSLETIIEFFEDSKIEIREIAFQHLEFTDRETLSEHKKIYREKLDTSTDFWEGFTYKGDFEIPKLISKIKEIKERKNSKIVFRPDLRIDEIEEFYTSSKIPKRFLKKCLAPWQEAFILPDGSVWTCADYVVGNIKEESFLKIWNNEKYRKLRKTINKIKFFPICKTCASLYVY